MFHVSGGSFKGVNYSWMYSAGEQYTHCSPNGLYYYVPGIIEDGAKTPNNVLVVLNKETDEIVHVRNLKDCDISYWDEMLAGVIKKLEGELDFLTKTFENGETVNHAG